MHRSTTWSSVSFQMSSPGCAPSSHRIMVLPAGAVHGMESGVSVTRE